MAEKTFTFRVDDEMKRQFTEIAKSRDRTAAQLMREFMRDTIAKQREEADYDAWFRAKVQNGLDQADAGLGISHEDVEARFDRIKAETREKTKKVS